MGTQLLPNASDLQDSQLCAIHCPVRWGMRAAVLPTQPCKVIGAYGNTQRLAPCDKANTRRSKANLIKIKWLDDKVDV